MKIALIVLTVILVFFVVRFTILGSKSRSMEVSLGVSEGRLNPCKSEKNCVYETHEHIENPIESLKELLKNEGHEIIKSEENYIHALAKSSLFGFVDDVEFHYVEASQKLHIRSASRVGNSDLGANSKRIKSIRERLLTTK